MNVLTLDFLHGGFLHGVHSLKIVDWLNARIVFFLSFLHKMEALHELKQHFTVVNKLNFKLSFIFGFKWLL